MDNNAQQWSKKYIPESIDDIIARDDTKKQIECMINGTCIMNTIITGVPGIGKTMIMHFIAKKILGKNYRNRSLTLIGSDDRGIKTISDTIVNFCKKKVDDSYKNIDVKLVLIDEADNMTQKAQYNLSVVMDKYSSSVKYILTCNNSWKIVESIQSKCSIMLLTRMGDNSIASHLRSICVRENVQCNEKGINAILNISNGDLRSAINNLQLVYVCCEKITEKNVFKLFDMPNPHELNELIKACVRYDLKDALNKLLTIINKGYSETDIILGLTNMLKRAKYIEESTKIRLILTTNETSLILSRGIDSQLQLAGCIANMCTNNAQ